MRRNRTTAPARIQVGCRDQLGRGTCERSNRRRRPPPGSDDAARGGRRGRPRRRRSRGATTERTTDAHRRGRRRPNPTATPRRGPGRRGGGDTQDHRRRSVADPPATGAVLRRPRVPEWADRGVQSQRRNDARGRRQRGPPNRRDERATDRPRCDGRRRGVRRRAPRRVGDGDRDDATGGREGRRRPVATPGLWRPSRWRFPGRRTDPSAGVRRPRSRRCRTSGRPRRRRRTA